MIFVIRTRRVPFWRSRPSRSLLLASLAVPIVGVAIPLSPFGDALGFTHLPAVYYPILVGLVATYLVLVEAAKTVFYQLGEPGTPLSEHRRHAVRRVNRRAARFTPPAPAGTPATVARR